MQESRFQELLAELKTLTPRQLRELSNALEQRSAADDVADTVNARMGEHPACPHCSSDQAQKWGYAGGLRRYRCKGCRKTFTGLTGTPLSGLHRKDVWIAYAEALKDGLSVRKAAEKCGVHFRTTFRWRHRWLRLPRDKKDTSFSGIVEADETYFLESHKGSKAWARASRGQDGSPPPSRSPRRRGGKASKRGLSAEQIPVIVLRDRTGATTDAVLPAVNQETVKAVIQPVLDKDALLCTDGNQVYKAMTKQAGIPHQPLNIKAGTRVKERIFHIQNVNAYHGRLKEWMQRFRGVATTYLPNYLGWRRHLERSGTGTAKDVLAAALA